MADQRFPLAVPTLYFANFSQNTMKSRKVWLGERTPVTQQVQLICLRV